MPSIDITEIAGRHAERDWPGRYAKSGAGSKIVYRLYGNSRPIDRIDRGQIKLTAEPGVGEQCFDEILTIVERPRDGDRMRVRGFDGGHLPPLHLRNAVVRVEDENVDPLAVATGLDRSGAGVPRSGPDNRQMLASSCEYCVE